MKTCDGYNVSQSADGDVRVAHLGVSPEHRPSEAQSEEERPALLP